MPHSQETHDYITLQNELEFISQQLDAERQEIERLNQVIEKQRIEVLTIKREVRVLSEHTASQLKSLLCSALLGISPPSRMSVASHSQKDEVNVKMRKEIMSARGGGELATAQIRVELREATEKAAQLTQQVRLVRSCATAGATLAYLCCISQIEVLNSELASREGRIAELEEQLEASRRTITEKEQSVLKMRIEASRSSKSVNTSMLEVCPARRT